MKNFEGYWRVTEMELWAQKDLDLLGPAHFIFESRHGLGSFCFIALQGVLDCRFSLKDGRPFAEFSWIGDDEGDMTSGRGWALIKSDGIMAGRFFFHQGDDSGFKARKSEKPPVRKLRSGKGS